MRSRLEAHKNKFVSCGQMEKAAYLEGQLTILKALESLILRYRDAASDAGNTLSADSLTHLLSDAPHTLQDALQMQRIIHFTMWCAGNYHNTLGRFDQYMMPYLQADLDAGRLTEESALELLEEFFLPSTWTATSIRACSRR